MLATNLLTGHSNTAGTSYTTGSISPIANTLVLLAVGSNTSNFSTPTVSGAGMTWTQIATVQTVNHTQMTLFRALTASPSSGALTISFSNTQSNVYWSADQFIGALPTGTNGADAIVQSVTGSTNNSGTSLSISLSALAKSTNAVFGAVVNSGAATIAVGSGLTELSNISDQQGFEAEWKNLGQTTVNWTWGPTGMEVSAIAVEIAAAQTGGGALFAFL